MAVNKLTYPSKDNAVQEKINEIIDDYVDLSNLSETGDNRLHALKGYEDAGELLTDAEGLVDVKKYAHSTFDSTKFTVVGSPTITNDGIISNITSANQVYTSVIPFSTSNTWKIKIKAKVNSLSATQRIFAGRNSINTQIIQIETSGAMKMWLSSLATGDIANNVSINYTASVGEILDVELVFTGTEYKVYINGNNTYTKASTTKISIDTAIFAFSGYGMGGMLGEQDLKQVQVTVDGIPVFSGNKTSIDTIKPDNYSIVGTPTITDDGVVSNITTSNYIKTPVAIPFATADTWDIECNVTFKANSSIQRIFGSADNNKSIIIQVAENTWLSWYISTNNSTYNLASNVGLGKNLVDGQKYKLRFSFTGTDYRFYFNDVEETSARISSTDKMADTVLGIFTGGTFAPMAGGQDLNSFKVHINGDLVYQPCLKIPYISSKSGSKVVDSVYCNRVADMYSQFGYSPYYTLSDTDFTLPQGELYGLINNSNKNTMRSTEFIVGTQTEITGSWTGTTEDSSLYDGKNINYFLPYAGSGNATLNLTLAGGTTTGAKPVYLSGTSYVTTHYGANSCINMTYNSTKGAWFVNADRDANTYDRLLYNNNLYSLEALTDGGLACGTKDGYKKIASGVIFDIDYPIIRTGNVNASSNFTGYLAFPGLNLQTTKASWTGTNRSMVYLVGTLSGKKFTIDSSVFTTTVPTSVDNKVYMPIGVLYSTYQIYFNPQRCLYAYKDGSFQQIAGIALNETDTLATVLNRGNSASTDINFNNKDWFNAGTRLTSYSYSTSQTPNTQYWWYKITPPSATNKADRYFICLESDENYPDKRGMFVLDISRYVAGSTDSISVSLNCLGMTANTTTHLINVAIDASGYVYVQCNTVWNSYMRFIRYNTESDTKSYDQVGKAAFGTVDGFTSLKMIQDTGCIRINNGALSGTYYTSIASDNFIGNLTGNAATATTASKLGTTDVGTATQGIYLDDGVAKACTYTVEKSVPSDAVFTDTKNTAGSTQLASTKLYLIGASSQADNPQTYSNSNFYITDTGKLNIPSPDASSNSTIAATTAWVNDKGFLTGISSSDVTTALGYTPQNSTTAVTHTASTAVGSATQPVYVASNGTATACTYTLEKSVPSNAVFTDTNTLMTQNVSTTDNTYPILACPTANATANQGEKTGIFGASVKLNPSTGTVVTNKVAVGAGAATMQYNSTTEAIEFVFA